jgi:DNA-binding MarR family transcriptional regulator
LNNYIAAMTARTRRNSNRRTHFDSLEQEVFLNVWRTYDRLRMLEDELFGQFDLTPQQYNVLRLLRAEYPQAVATLVLASRLVSRAPDITRILDKLDDRQLIVRERLSDNRRVVEVRISEGGVALLDQIADPLRQCHTRQLGHMSATELKELCRLLREARGPHEESAGHWH